MCFRTKVQNPPFITSVGPHPSELNKPKLSDKMTVIKTKRRKNLISTEFSPSEWNINNLNKFKK